MKRLVIYFHYDAQGSLDEPCRFAIRALCAEAELVLVTNGTLSRESRDWVAGVGLRLIERENTGFDVGAYRQALLALGRETVSGYEELILMNYTLAGPVCSLKPMLDAMQTHPELDFWGLTRHYAMRSRRFGGQVPEHLQSHFLAIRQNMMQADAFWDYWQKMELPRSYEESVIRHETRFTRYFSELGYTWDSYVQTEDLKSVFVNPIMACPKELLENRGCPFFKRRSFFTPYEDELRRTDGLAARELYEYLKGRTGYPVDALLQSLLRTQPLSSLAKNLHWHYIVGEDGGNPSISLQTQGLALVRLIVPERDTVTDWYLRQSVQSAEKQIAQAAALFERNPLLGVLSPALPLWPEALRFVRQEWQANRKELSGQVSVSVGEDPPPAPCAGWALVRRAAFPQGIPVGKAMQDIWLLPLLAQQNGYYSATFESASQAAARTEHLCMYARAASEPAAVVRQLGRLVKHKLKG